MIAILGTLLFSTKAIWIKLCFKESKIDATTLLMLRMLISLPFYLIVLWYTKRNLPKKIDRKLYGWAIVMGILGYYLSSLFDFIGLQYISAGMERIILFIYPTLAVLINFWLFKVAITPRQWIAIGITYLGIGIAYWGEFNHLPNTSLFLYGSLMVFLCGVIYAFYLVGTGKLVPQLGSSQFTSITMIAASIGIIIHYLIEKTYLNSFHQAIHIDVDSTIIGYVIGLSLVATVIPSFLFNFGMKRVGSNDVSILTSIGPVSTLFQAHYILDEPLLWQQMLGTVFVIVGVLLVQKKWSNQEKTRLPQNYPSPKG